MNTVWESRRSGGVISRPGGFRDDFERDRARIVHSAAFRRLQAKTQVLGISDGDFHRTRLTHSMEVAQIGKGIVTRLREKSDFRNSYLPSVDLIEAIGFAHDLGHPPFGHGGEVALNSVMKPWGGFESNGQTLRLLSRLESHTPGFGLNLTRRTLLGILKYPCSYSQLLSPQGEIEIPGPPKCYHDSEGEIVRWILEPFSLGDRELFVSSEREAPDSHGASLYCGFDTSIMELADDVSYGVHDFEDGVAIKLISRDMWEEVVEQIDSSWLKDMRLTDLGDKLFDRSTDAHHFRKSAIGGLVHALIISAHIVDVDGFDDPMFSYKVKLTDPAQKLLDGLQGITLKYIIHSQSVQTIEYKGRHMVERLFEAIASAPEKLLPREYTEQYLNKETANEKMRVICDYIASMSDAYAGKIYERLFIPGRGTSYDQLY